MYRYYNSGKRIVVTFFSTLINLVKFLFWGVVYESIPKTRGVIHIVSRKRGSISIGRNVVINSGKHRNPVGAGGVQTVFNCIGEGAISIGNNVSISNATIVSMKGIQLCDYVMIGNGVTIYDTDFHSVSFENRKQKNDPDICSKCVRIEKGAFIGAGSIILKGVNIGENSVVGAGSVVTKSIPNREVWAGNPAKFIKQI